MIKYTCDICGKDGNRIKKDPEFIIPWGSPTEPENGIKVRVCISHPKRFELDLCDDCLRHALKLSSALLLKHANE